MNNSFLQIELQNLDELKKLINEAEHQIDQLKGTLENIENFKARVVFLSKDQQL